MLTIRYNARNLYSSLSLIPQSLRLLGSKPPHCRFTSNLTNDAKAESASWIESKVIPQLIRPYLYLARADKQVGTYLLLWPCIWSTALAAPLGCLPEALLLAKFSLGALVMRGAGCTINDLWDIEFDKHVERTRSRPLASGALSIPQALTFLGFQLSIGLGVLLSFNAETIILGLASMPLVVCYPLMKRFTNWPQLVLGLTFNWGALVGWTAAASGSSNSVIRQVIDNNSGSLDVVSTAEQIAAMSLSAISCLPAGLLYSALPLYGAGVCWTLIYDTLYGYQDRKDDLRIEGFNALGCVAYVVFSNLGVKSTALALGDRPQLPLSVLSVGMLSGLWIAGASCDLSAPFYCGAVAMWGHSLWQIWTADLNDSSNLWSRFNSNKYSGGFLALSIVAGHF